MQETVNQLKKQVEDLQTQITSLSQGTNNVFPGNLDEILVERVFNSTLTGTAPAPTTSGPYANNNLLYQQALTGLAQDIKVLNFPSRVMIYTWKGQRLAIPVYDATNIIYP